MKHGRRSKWIQVRDDGFIFCNKCHTYKHEDEFDLNTEKQYRNGRDSRCKECKKDQYLKRREQNRGKQNLDRILLERLHGMKDRSKKKNIPMDVTIEDLKYIWACQEGLCAISKMPMTYIFNNGRTFTNVSIDQINPNKGYVKGNIQLVCMAVNQMKSDLSMNELYMFCEAIIKNKK